MTSPAPFVSLFAPFVAALVIGFAAAAHAADPLPMLLAAPSAAGQPARVPEPGTAVARQRLVRIDTGYLDPRSPSTPPALALELFDGVVVPLDRLRIEARAPGNYTWYGKVRGHPQNDAMVTVVDGFVSGTITIHDAGARRFARYAIASAADGSVWLREIDTRAFPPDHEPGHERMQAPPEPRAQAADAPANDSGALVDVMVVYSNQTAAAAGGAIVAQIQAAVDAANQAYANSNIAPRLRLVHTAPVNYNESGNFSTDLTRLTSTADGHMDNVHTLRDAYGADVVNMFIEGNGACGIGWVNSSAPSAFTVVNRGCATGNLSFAHEIGHNFGALHDPFVDPGTTPYAYGHGYTDIPGHWRTVMAYNDACIPTGGCTRVAQFSNPDINYAGAPTGTVPTHDNARVHDERALTLANFRQAAMVGAPLVTTFAASATSATSATLNGIVTSNGAATTVTFQYGTTVAYGIVGNAAQSPLSASASGAAVSAVITNLVCNTLYHYRVVGANATGTTNGADLTFTTGACSTTPPAVTTNLASSITAFGAILTGTASSNGFSTTVTFEYGTTIAYGSTIAAAQSPLAPGAAGMPVSASIGGLVCNTVYHYRAHAVSAGGSATGADVPFTTAPCSTAPPSTTIIASNVNPVTTGTLVTITAFVTGATPTGTVTFRDNGVPIPACTAVQVLGTSATTRTAVCAISTLLAGTHPIDAAYSGNVGNAPSTSSQLPLAVVSTLPVTVSVVTNPYGPISVQGGSIAGNTITIFNPTAVIQLGPTPGAPGSAVQLDFAALHVATGHFLTVRSGAPGQTVVLRNAGSVASAIGGTISAQGSPAPQLYLWNGAGIAIAPSATVNAPAGLSLDALGSDWFTGQTLTHQGNVNGGPNLQLYGANIRGGGAFRGNAIGIHTFGSANNPVNGAFFLQNGLQLHPSAGDLVALTLNAYGPGKQVLNLYVNGNATAWMPSSWPMSMNLPQNNAVVPPNGSRPPGVPEPAYGGGSMILQTLQSLALVNGGTNDFAFPGAIVLKAGVTLDTNGVVVNQGWTTSGQSFQGVFFEAPNIVTKPLTYIQVYGNDLNWINFSTMPNAYARVFSLKPQPDGSASFVPTDTSIPHMNTFSVIQNTAASGGCWTCQINPAPINVYGP